MNNICIVHPPQYDSYDWNIYPDVPYTEIILHDRLNPKCPCHPKVVPYIPKVGSKKGQLVGLVTHRHIDE